MSFQIVDIAEAKDVSAARVLIDPSFVMNALDSLAPEGAQEPGELARVGQYEVLAAPPENGAGAGPAGELAPA